MLSRHLPVYLTSGRISHRPIQVHPVVLQTEETTMYDIFIDTHFAGAHHLRDYPGECEKPHGHNWKVKVTVRATEVDSCGMELTSPC